MTHTGKDDIPASEMADRAQLAALEAERRALLSELERLTGETLSPALWSGTVSPHWPAKAREIAARYDAARHTASALRSKLEVARMRRFLRAPDTAANAVWWHHRY